MKKLLTLFGTLLLLSIPLFAQDADVIELTFETPITEVVFLSDTQLAVAQSESASVGVYNITSGELQATFELSGLAQIRQMVVSADGDYIAMNVEETADEDTSASAGTYVYTSEGEFITRLEPHSQYMQFFEDDRLFVLDDEKSSLLYDIPSITPQVDNFSRYAGEVMEEQPAMFWNKSGTTYIPIGAGSIDVVTARNNEHTTAYDGNLYGAQISPNESHVGYVFEDGRAAIYDVESDILVAETTLVSPPQDISWSPDSTFFAVSTRTGVQLLSFDRERSIAIVVADDNIVPRIAFSPDSSLLAVITDTGVTIHPVTAIDFATEEPPPSPTFVAPTSSILIPTVPPTVTRDAPTVAPSLEVTEEVTEEATEEPAPTDVSGEATEDVSPTDPIAEATEDVAPTDAIEEPTPEATSTPITPPTANVVVPTVAIPTPSQ